MAAWPLFADTAEREAMRQAQADDPQDPDCTLRLAWSLRQGEQAALRPLLQALSTMALDVAQRARLRLIEGELDWLGARAEAALAAAEQAQSVSDPLLQADAEYLRARLHTMRADPESERQALVRAADWARQAGEPRRVAVFEADQARAHCFRDNPGAFAQWQPRLPASIEGLPAEVAAAVADFRGVHAALRADYPGCLLWFERAQAAALESGQTRRAMTLVSNRAYNLGQMNEQEQALALLQDQLPQVRALDWPVQLGGLLTHCAEILRQLDQAGLAADTLHEALDWLAKAPQSRNMAAALNTLGRVELQRGRAQAALDAYQRMQAMPVGYTGDLRVIGGCGMARALLALERPHDALREIDIVLAQARQQSNRQHEVEALGVRAEVLTVLGDAGALAGYETALELAEQVPDFQPEPSLVEAAARALAQAGRFERAYALALRAGALRQAGFSNESARRIGGLRAQHQIARAQAENEHLRERSLMLQEELELLLRLSEIGQEIATAIESARVHQVLERQLERLLQPQAMALSTPDQAGELLLCRRGRRAGLPLGLPPLSLSNSHEPRALALRTQAAQFERAATGAEPLAVHMPLLVSGRCLGVLSVWGGEEGPRFGQREQLILRVLATYGAVALANAEAYRQLSDLQQQLMQQERHAALGAMVAGVAHELNTPIGNSLLVVTTLRERLQAFATRLDPGQAPMLRRELRECIEAELEGMRVIEGGMQAAARLIGSFKQVAVDRSSERRAEFDLRSLCQDCVQTLGLAMRRAHVEVELQVPEDLRLDSYPGTLSQVLIVLLNNALMHAFAGRNQGRVWVAATMGAAGEGGEPGYLSLSVSDDGLGMPPEVQRRVFEPFFTTKFGQGGSGLGLSIAHNLVQQVLGGRIELQSQAGIGTRFVLDLPLKAP